MTFSDPAPEKLARVQDFLEEHRLDAVLLASYANFAWITGGAPQRDDDPGGLPAAVLIVRDSAGNGRMGKCHFLRPGTPLSLCLPPDLESLAVDIPSPGAALLPQQFRRLHAPLLPDEVERYRRLGEDLGVCLTMTAFHSRPGLTRDGVRGMLAGRMVGMGIEPVRIAAALDSEGDAGRQSRLEGLLRLSVCGRRDGLHAATTRMIAFEPPEAPLLARHAVLQRAAASLLVASRPGAFATDILSRAVEALVGQDLADVARRDLGDPGGEIGYHPPADDAVTWLVDWLQTWRHAVDEPPKDPPPECTTLQRLQAYAWRLKVGLTCCEDTYLLTEFGPDLLTATPDLPTDEIEIDGKVIRQPAILVR